MGWRRCRGGARTTRVRDKTCDEGCQRRVARIRRRAGESETKETCSAGVVCVVAVVRGAPSPPRTLYMPTHIIKAIFCMAARRSGDRAPSREARAIGTQGRREHPPGSPATGLGWKEARNAFHHHGWDIGRCPNAERPPSGPPGRSRTPCRIAGVGVVEAKPVPPLASGAREGAGQTRITS